ncbi:MAG: glucuronate isomerase [Candidatus Acidiferrales bacterium]
MLRIYARAEKRMAFITEDFLLQSKTARRLYHSYAQDIPILDFHSHLSPAEIAGNARFQTLADIWLEGDHYKWRAMRASGIAEKFCSGDAAPQEKFMAWAKTVPRTLRNPLYHWTHLELNRYFGIQELLDESSAAEIWRNANAALQSEEMTPQGILRKFRVVALCTTDDPTDSLEAHEKIRKSGSQPPVFPTYRPDGALRTNDPARFNEWTSRLGSVANVEIARLADFQDALAKRHDFFHEHGCRLSDHGLHHCYAEPFADHQAADAFGKLRWGRSLEAREAVGLAGHLMIFFGHLDAQKGWTKQLHLGANRNTNSRMLATLGADAGFDSSGDWPQGAALGAYCDQLDRENSLPKMIVYNLNPADNYIFATMAGNFPQEGVNGKVQFGASWWFLDQKEGIEWQLNALSNCGLLANFVGMVTDSRSFMSFPRHEYFRRILCNMLGNDIEAGLLPNDEPMLARLIKDVCLDNAARFLALPNLAD